MKRGQDAIYFLPGDSKEAIMKSPLLAKYKQLGIEVFIMGDPIDEFCMQHLAEYEKHKIKNIAKEDGNPLQGDELQRKKELKIKEMYKPLTTWWKKHLEKKVEKVSVSNRLVDEPCYVFTSQYGYSPHMEKINRAQAFANQEKTPNYMLAKKHFEINPHHPVMKQMLERIKESNGEPNEETLEQADLIFNLALFTSGFLIEDPSQLNVPVQALIRQAFGVPKDSPVEEIEVNIDEDEGT